MAEDIVHPLRRRMIEDMTARNLDEVTQRGYLRSVRSCCRFCQKQPAQLTYEDVRRFQLQRTRQVMTRFPGRVGHPTFSAWCGWRSTVSDRPFPCGRSERGFLRPAR